MKSNWSREEVFNSGDHYFKSVIQRMGRARTSIDLEAYIFDFDILGQRILEALVRAADRGVRVRVLVDGVGSSHWNHGSLLTLRDSGIHVRIYHPLPWQSGQFSWLGLMHFRELLRRFYQLNRRNHRKTCTIDGKQSFVAGMNVSARHLTEINTKGAWRDSAVWVEGSECAKLQSAFHVAWNSVERPFWQGPIPLPLKELSPQSLVWLNVTRRTRRLFHKTLIQKIASAQDRVWITTPYLVPDLALLRSLRRARRSGADVRILLPYRNDLFFMKWVAHAFYSALHLTGARIYEYLPTILHAKTCVIDDWALVGSSNLNSRSVIHDLEADVVLTHAKSLEVLGDQFKKDLSQSIEVTAENWKRRTWPSKALEWIARRFKFWM